jgi:chemotaxis protein CheD
LRPGEYLQNAPADLPPALAEFGHIRRSFDPTRNAAVARLLPGEYYITRHDELIFTVLGSCVSACVRERKLGIGGMNHFMLPTDRSGGNSAWSDNLVSSATRYGNVAMDRLIKGILQFGGAPENLEFKVVGGGKVLDTAIDVGGKNVQFVREYLSAQGYSVSAEDLGDSFARKVYYNPRTGAMRVKRLATTYNTTVFERELQYAQTPSP